MPRAIRAARGEIQLFADDVTIWGRSLGHDGDKQLRRALEALLYWAALWKMLINLRKSHCLVFSMRRYIPAFSLGGSALVVLRHARYLGVWFSSTLSWVHHTQRVLARIKASSNLISRVADGVSSPRVVRSLILAIVRSQIAYGFPIWEPSASSFRRLQSYILQPLRRAIGLPQSAQSESVLAEYGVPTLERHWEQRLLAWAARNTRIIREGPALRDFPAACHYRETHKRPHSLPFRALSVFDDWKKGQDKIRPQATRRLLPDYTPSMLKRLAISLSYSDWRAPPDGSSPPGSLQVYRRDDWPGLAPYLRFDDRATACLRARLRFARSYLLSHRRSLGLSATDVCEECKAGSAETIVHVICFCDKYASARRVLQKELASMGVPFTSHVVLGDWKAKPPVIRKILSVTGAFLNSVHEHRSL